jgi:ubiquinone/menaquinone biosynthesis C-methylase UbiE
MNCNRTGQRPAARRFAMVSSSDPNLSVYNKRDIARLYQRSEGLQPAEIYLFKKYIRPGSAIIDIGVGGGRTTPYLSQLAGEYIGIDYSQAMVDVCKEKFPNLNFICMDATDLSNLDDNKFDFTVFSFNGIDCIPTDEGRIKCLRELNRITRTDGYIILSSHNAKVLAILPRFDGARGLRIIWRIIYAMKTSTRIALHHLFSKVFYKGDVYKIDPVHGGLLTYNSTPITIARDAKLAHLQIIESADYYMSKFKSKYIIGWYYYVLQKI